MSDEARQFLDQWLALRDLSQSEAQQRFSVPANQIETNITYQGLSNLTKLPISAGSFFFRDGKFVLLYAGNIGQTMPQFTLKFLLGEFGTPAEKLPSRAGRGHQMYVYPDKGVTFSAVSDEVDFIEIYKPTTLTAYKTEIYKDPGQFKR